MGTARRERDCTVTSILSSVMGLKTAVTPTKSAVLTN